MLAIVLASNFYVFFFRDNFSTHFPTKHLFAEALRGGNVPFWNFHAGGGQPLAGNPNYLSFYPDNILYLILPSHAAFNLHFIVHITLAFFAMRFLIATVGVTDRLAMNGAALVYVMSGVVVSTTSFYNLVCATALGPAIIALAIHTATDSRWRHPLALGTCCGLLGLAGEPTTVIAVTLVSAVLVIDRLTLAASLRFGAAAAIAAVVAMPQVLAYGEIAPMTERVVGYSPRAILSASLEPWRIVEMLFGPVFGLVTDPGPAGLRQSLRSDTPVFFISLAIGVIAIPALFQRASLRLSRVQVAAAVLSFVALGRNNPVMRWLVEELTVLRFARFPEKFALPMTVMIALLVAAFLAKERYTRWDRSVTLLAVVAAAGGTGLAFFAGFNPQTVARFAVVTILATVLAFSLRIERRSARLSIQLAVTLVPLLYAIPRIALIAPTDLMAARNVLEQKLAGRRIWRPSEQESVEFTRPDMRQQYEYRAAMIDPISGAVHGVRYALNPSPEGMYSWLTRIVRDRATTAPGHLRVRYARLQGCEFLVMTARTSAPGTRLLERFAIGTNELNVYELVDARPAVYAPRRLVNVATIDEARAAIEQPTFDEAHEITAPRSVVAPQPMDVKVSGVRRRADTIEFTARSSSGGAVVVNESFFPAWSAKASGRSVTTFAANIDRLGVMLPPGEHRVEVRFGQRRDVVYFTFALSMLVCLATPILLFAARRRSSHATAAPAR